MHLSDRQRAGSRITMRRVMTKVDRTTADTLFTRSLAKSSSMFVDWSAQQIESSRLRMKTKRMVPFITFLHQLTWQHEEGVDEESWASTV